MTSSFTLLKKLSSTCLNNFRRQTRQVRLLANYQAAVARKVLEPLALEEKTRKELAENDVRIQVHYCSVNSGDLHNFKNRTDFPFTPGYELAGEVIEVGKKITNEQVILGERVAGLSLEQFGGFAQECVLNINDIFRLPSNVQLNEAAVLISGHATALLAFSKMSEISKDDYVLISAGPAGLGLAAVDVAANVYKAKVIGVVDSEERAELLRQRGAFKTVHYGKKFHKEVLAATNKKGPIVVYDAVDERINENIGACVAHQGTVFYAASSFYKTIPAPRPNSEAMILSMTELRQNDLELYRCIINDTLDLADQGVIGAHVSAKFNFKEINEAIKFIEDKKCNGKVVIKILE